MTQQPIDYATDRQATMRCGWLGTACLCFSVAGIVLGLGLFGLGALIGFGARGGGPGILVAITGVILGPLLNLAAFVMGIVALFRKGPHRARAIIGTALSGIIVLPPLALAAILVVNNVLK